MVHTRSIAIDEQYVQKEAEEVGIPEACTRVDGTRQLRAHRSCERGGVVDRLLRAEIGCHRLAVRRDLTSHRVAVPVQNRCHQGCHLLRCSGAPITGLHGGAGASDEEIVEMSSTFVRRAVGELGRQVATGIAQRLVPTSSSCFEHFRRECAVSVEQTLHL
jgi:hypothetical protein